MKKRILSILLALCMLFCLVPTTAFAEGETNRKVETEQELVDALADSSVDIITLKNDIAIGTTLTVLRKVTLDLNGYVLKMTGSGSVIILDNIAAAVLMKFLIDIDQGRRDLHRRLYGKAQSMRLPRLVVRVLSKDHYFYF